MGDDYDTIGDKKTRARLGSSVPPPTSAKTALADHLRDRTPSEYAPGEAFWTLDDDSDPAGRFKRHGRVRGHVREV